MYFCNEVLLIKNEVLWVTDASLSNISFVIKKKALHFSFDLHTIVKNQKQIKVKIEKMFGILSII
jgi:hypothetical protein